MKEKTIARVVVTAFLLIGILIISYVGIYILFIKGVIGIVAVPIFIQLSIAFLSLVLLKVLLTKFSGVEN